jgi:hypothetical protein
MAAMGLRAMCVGRSGREVTLIVCLSETLLHLRTLRCRQLLLSGAGSRRGRRSQAPGVYQMGEV